MKNDAYNRPERDRGEGCRVEQPAGRGGRAAGGRPGGVPLSHHVRPHDGARPPPFKQENSGQVSKKILSSVQYVYFYRVTK